MIQATKHTTTDTTPATFTDQRADLAIEALAVVDADAEPADAVVRLLADLYHLADRAGLDLHRLSQIAKARHAQEVAEESADAGDSWGGPSDGLKLRTGQDRRPVQRGANFRAPTGGKRGPKRRRGIKA